MKSKILPSDAIKSENTLQTLASVILFLGIGGGIIYGISNAFVSVPNEYYGSEHYEFNFAGLAVGVGIIFESIIAWAILKVLSEISISLKRIYHFHNPNFYSVTESEVDTEKSKEYIWKKNGKKVKFAYNMGEVKYFMSSDNGIGVGSIPSEELEEIIEDHHVSRQEILARPKLDKEALIISPNKELNGFQVGEKVILISKNTTGYIEYFTEEGHAVVKTTNSIEPYYIDDLKEMK